MNTVWVTADIVGFHAWTAAPESVSYLRTLHRHKFFVRAEVDAQKRYYTQHDGKQLVETDNLNDRFNEFHQLKYIVSEALEQQGTSSAICPSGELVFQSCEMIANGIAQQLVNAGYVVYEVQVSEDGECGATYRSLAQN